MSANKPRRRDYCRRLLCKMWDVGIGSWGVGKMIFGFLMFALATLVNIWLGYISFGQGKNSIKGAAITYGSAFAVLILVSFVRSLWFVYEEDQTEINKLRDEVDRITWPSESPDLRIDSYVEQPMAADTPATYQDRRGFFLKNQGTDTAKNVLLERFKLQSKAGGKEIWITGTSDVNAIDKGDTKFIGAFAEGGTGFAPSTGARFDLLEFFSQVSKERGTEHELGMSMEPVTVFVTYEGRNGSKYRTVSEITFHPIRSIHFDFKHVRRERLVGDIWQP